MRAWNDKATPDILDIIRMERPTPSSFVRQSDTQSAARTPTTSSHGWIGSSQRLPRTRATTRRKERDMTLGEIREAREVFKQRR